MQTKAKSSKEKSVRKGKKKEHQEEREQNRKQGGLEQNGQHHLKEGVDPNKIYSCPYVDWYKFLRCRVTTCKNYNKATDCRCLAVDRIRPEGNKVISDAELNLYKFDSKENTRHVQVRRKRAIRKVKSILILREFIEFIRDNAKEGGVWTSETTQKLEAAYPLKIAKLGWANWMWEPFLDQKMWEAFCATTQGGECSEFGLHTLLSTKLETIEALYKELNM